MSLRNGRTLKAARTLAGLTQRQLAVLAGLHPNSVKHWEGSNERIGGFAVRRMVEALGHRGVYCGEEHVNGSTVAVLRG